MYTYMYVYIYTHTNIHTHSRILRHRKKEIIPSVATWLDLETHTEWSQRKINTIYHLHVESKKNDTNQLIYKKETES